MELGNPAEFDISRTLKTGFQESKAMLSQLQILKDSVTRKMQIANSKLQNGIDLTIDQEVILETGDLSAEEFEEAVQ